LALIEGGCGRPFVIAGDLTWGEAGGEDAAATLEFWL